MPLVVIFLDIDGVLLPFPETESSTCGGIFPDAPLHALSRILEAVPASKLVLSSTWRSQTSAIRDILHSFQQYGGAHGGPLRNLTEFFDLTDVNFHDERQTEIFRYLKENPSIDAWCALDDEDLLLERYRSTFENHSIYVNCRTGLTERDAKQAINLLQNQLCS